MTQTFPIVTPIVPMGRRVFSSEVLLVLLVLLLVEVKGCSSYSTDPSWMSCLEIALLTMGSMRGRIDSMSAEVDASGDVCAVHVMFVLVSSSGFSVVSLWKQLKNDLSVMVRCRCLV